MTEEITAQAARVTAASSAERERARKLTARHVGVVGDRTELDLTLVRYTDLTQSRFDPLFLIFTFRDNDGNTIVYKGGRPAALANVYELGDRVRVKASIKAHDEYRGEPQTIIARPALVEMKEIAA